MDRLPLSFNIRNRRVVLVGGGELAARKVRLVRRAGGRITIIAPRLNPELAALAEEQTIGVQRRPFTPNDLDTAAIVFAATGLPATDEAVAAAARDRGIPVNAVDRPDISTFTVPAIVDRDPVVVSIATDGTAPVLARQIRALIERLLPSRLGTLAQFAAQFRSAISARIALADRRAFWERFFAGPIADLVLRGELPAARERMLRSINGQRGEGAAGRVYIVGAGPGDPDLLTLRAFRLLQQADVIVYDRLVGPEILDYARRDAERIYVGKAKGAHSKSQAWINNALAQHAHDGKTVVRLKGGDPFVFGRGGEELAYLRKRGIDAEVIPGITAATGCAAAAGIPLTERGIASGVTFVTGHGADGDADIDWPGLAQSRNTLVVYMGISTAPGVAVKLMRHGLSPTTPVAIIENGTRGDQRIVTGQLSGLSDLASAAGINGPAIIVIGEVARAGTTKSLAAALPLRAVG